MNIIVLTGCLGRDAELKTFGDTKVANFSIAVKDFKKGEDASFWMNVTCFGKTAEVVEKYTKKGSKIGVSGKIQVEKYTAKDGTEKTKTFVNADKVELLDSKKDNQSKAKDEPTEEVEYEYVNYPPLPIVDLECPF